MSTVLIQGDTGTGKELVARAIHGSTDRAEQPFIAVNCGALPDTLLESELFGYKKGAFTGAYNDKPGLMSLARNGTLFLDEIGEVSPAMQVKLLRILQEREFQPLGGTTQLNFKARVIAATNRDLVAMVKTGAFREDLFYRINVIRIELPTLDQRKEDIPMLIEYFIEKFNHIYGKNLKGFSNEALSAIMNHNWPGNIRELENVVERSAILCSGKTIGINCLPEELFGEGHNENSDIFTLRGSAEAKAIENALIRNGFNKAKTARELGIHKATLYRKLKKYAIK
jgi:transcriptional regulator with PAS, ATPase and Fis domain